MRSGTLWIAGRSWTRRTRRGRGGAGEAEGRRRGRTQATDIKSNNPHLAGGEIHFYLLCLAEEAKRKAMTMADATAGRCDSVRFGGPVEFRSQSPVTEAPKWSAPVLWI